MRVSPGSTLYNAGMIFGSYQENMLRTKELPCLGAKDTCTKKNNNKMDVVPTVACDGCNCNRSSG